MGLFQKLFGTNPEPRAKVEVDYSGHPMESELNRLKTFSEAEFKYTVWLSAGDKHVCKGCLELNGKKIGLAEAKKILLSGSHCSAKHCRCVLTVIEED